ncbi:MAG: hydratase [Lachnospiraceae bacterium]|jgi:aconitate hydratase|nr:hydratase [Lachnospiraceae bacterium]
MANWIELVDKGVYLKNQTQLLPAQDIPHLDKEAARKGTMAYRILQAHNQSDDQQNLKIKFDMLTSHDITYVGIIQTAKASGLVRFPIPYVLTNCHNSLCAVGGTINEDDHMFGLTSAQKYGGVYVPPHQAVIHQYAREKMAAVGKMILGSDSHTRYGALGTMAIGEGGPELVKQLLCQPYEITMPQVVGIYLHGAPIPGVGPQDVALAIIGAVFDQGFVKNKIMEFVGPGIANLSADFRIGIDVMTTETTCLSSIWQTDEQIEEYYEIHQRSEDYQALAPNDLAYYDSAVSVDLSAIRPMIAMPFHPSNVYTIDEVIRNPKEIIEETEKRAKVSLGEEVSLHLMEKVKDGKFYVEQGIIAGCAGGGFENICAAADLLHDRSIGAGPFTLSIYPASTPIYMELLRNGRAAKLLETGAILKTAFCGPCFGAGDTPANNSFSIRHSTRNFPNREGSKLQNGQIASVALMDARSIAATAANQGVLTPATEMPIPYHKVQYAFDSKIYDNRVFDSHGQADPNVTVQLGPNIKDWPQMPALTDNLLLRVVSEIHDPVTTTDELIPSGETSSYRSNPMGLAEYTLSRKDPAYVGRAKQMRLVQIAQEQNKDPWNAVPELALSDVKKYLDQELTPQGTIGFGSLIYATKPGDGSAREQAASCQKVLGGWANIATEYATKRYRSNLINWGILPFFIEKGDLPFHNLDYIWIPGIRSAVENAQSRITAYRISPNDDQTQAFPLSLGEFTDQERKIILSGCLINNNRIPE